MQSHLSKHPILVELADLLKQKGWKQLSPSTAVLNYCDYIWQKKIDCPTVCQSTGELFVNLYNYNMLQDDREEADEESGSFAIEIVAKSTDGYWARHEKYGIQGSELKDVLDDQIAKLVKAWEALN